MFAVWKLSVCVCVRGGQSKIMPWDVWDQCTDDGRRDSRLGCGVVFVCVLGIFWITKEEIAVRVARKTKSGMDVYRYTPKVWDEDRILMTSVWVGESTISDPAELGREVANWVEIN
jgi:hypothetical protein